MIRNIDPTGNDLRSYRGFASFCDIERYVDSGEVSIDWLGSNICSHVKAKVQDRFSTNSDTIHH